MITSAFPFCTFFFLSFSTNTLLSRVCSVPCGQLSADVVALWADAGVTQLKQGQHLPCGALVSNYQQGKGGRKGPTVRLRAFTCTADQGCGKSLLSWL